MFDALHTDALTAPDVAPCSERLEACRAAARAARLNRLNHLLGRRWMLPRRHVTVTVQRLA